MFTVNPAGALNPGGAETQRAANLDSDELTPAWLLTTLDRLSEGVVVTTTAAEPSQARMVFVNDAVCRLTGYAREELLGRSPWMLHGPETDLAEIERLRANVQAGREYRGQLRHYRRDGSSFLAEWIITPIVNDDGQVTHSVALERDLSAQQRAATALREANADLEQRVTERTSALADLARQLSSEVAERVRSDEALRLSEQRFRLLCEQLPVGVFLADAEAACRYTNPRLQAINNATAEELAGDGYIRRIHRDDREAVIAQWRADTAAGRESDTCFRLVPAPGQIRWVRARSLAVRNDAGELLGYVGSLKDITDERQAEEALRQAHADLERRVEQRTRDLTSANEWLAAEVRERRQVEQALRDSEARWRTLVENAPAYILLLDVEGRVEFLNRARPGMDREVIVGDSIYNRVHPDTLPHFREQLAACLASGETIEFEATGMDPDGAIIWYQTRVAPILEGNVARGWLLVSTDITDRRRAEDKARKRQAELAHVARISTATELATGLAHEINQPLTAIASSADALLRFLRNGETLDNSETVRVIESIAEQSQRAANIVRHLRGFVRKATPSRSATDINQLIEDTVLFMRHEASRGEVRLETDLVAGLPPLMIDSVQIQQVLVNLIKNACESAREVPVEARRILIRTARPDEASVEILVQDRGPGIDAHIAPQVFDTFFTTKSTGLGLGLSISRSLVEDHGGRLTMTPNPDCGVTFHCRLPTLGSTHDSQRSLRVPG